MGEFLRILLEKIMDWWPMRIIDAGNQGIRWRSNGTNQTLQPGWHLFVPKLQRIDEVGCQYQNQDCGLQSLTTKDGVEVSLSLNVGYSINDAALLYRSFQHFDTSLINMARGHAAEIVCDTDWQELASDPQGFGDEIREALADDFEALGVDIEDVTADQLSRARTFRVLQTTANV